MSLLRRASFLLAGACFALAVVAWPAACAQPPEQLHIAAAISLKAPMEEIAAAFKTQTGSAVTVSFASSGQIMNQIQGGAPIDVFISAAHTQMDELAKRGLIDDASRRIIATNTLVLIVPAGAGEAPAGFAELAGRAIGRLAVGEPRTVPAGQYARQALENLGLYDRLRDRLIYGSNVRQVIAYVERGEVDAGIVYRTDARESGDRVKVIAEAEAGWHDPIEYPAAIVTATQQRDAASRFLDFLSSEPARQILEAHGFGAKTN